MHVQQKISSFADLAEISAWLRERSAKPQHERLVYRAWLRRAAWPEPGAGKLPRTLCAGLPFLREELAALAVSGLRREGGDGVSSKMLLRLSDGRTVESVVLPKNAVCVSTQVGCAVGCAFCMTGRGGLTRQLGSAEIVAQVAAAREINPAIRKVDFMGMGEPAHNLRAVMEAVQFLGTYGDFGHKSLMISSSGSRRLFQHLMALPRQAVKPALALSLHSTRDELRSALMPHADKMTVRDLVAAAEAYSRMARTPVQYEWVLLQGVNDGVQEADGLIALLAGRSAMVNVIPVNEVSGSPFKRPPKAACLGFVRRLREAGIVSTIRQSAAQDVLGGCGQLRSRLIEGAAGSAARRALDISA